MFSSIRPCCLVNHHDIASIDPAPAGHAIVNVCDSDSCDACDSQSPSWSTVATVATVASVIVASATSAQSVIDPLRDFTAAIRSGVLQQCQACRHFTKLIPADRNNPGVADAGWRGRYSVDTHPLTPFWCDGYSPFRSVVCARHRTLWLCPAIN